MKKCFKCGALYRGAPKICPKDGSALIYLKDEGIGTYIGGWQLVEKIAENALATVFRAQKDDLSGALKLYSPSAPLQRVLREGGAQQRISHPNVATLLDQGFGSDGEFYLVTEFIEGETLRTVLDERKNEITWSLAVSIAKQTSQGLEAIHQSGLVHRDLKPENLMLRGRAEISQSFAGSLLDNFRLTSSLTADEKSGAAHVTILDLGHALFLDDVRLTQSGLVLGSAAYMSPEQACGEKVDARSDLYSLGVILYEMLEGKRPFDGKTPVDVMLMHCNHVPTPLSRRADVPSVLSELCMWLLAKDPQKRVASARVATAALDGIKNL